MNVKEMIAWLETQPQDAIVEVVCTESYSGSWTVERNATTEKFDVIKHAELYDWTNNKFVKPNDPHYNKKVLTLGYSD